LIEYKRRGPGAVLTEVRAGRYDDTGWVQLLTMLVNLDRPAERHTIHRHSPSLRSRSPTSMVTAGQPHRLDQ